MTSQWGTWVEFIDDATPYLRTQWHELSIRYYRAAVWWETGTVIVQINGPQLQTTVFWDLHYPPQATPGTLHGCRASVQASVEKWWADRIAERLVPSTVPPVIGSDAWKMQWPGVWERL